MKKIPYKVRLWIGIGLVLWSVLAVITTIIYAAYGTPMWILITGPIVAVVAFAIGIIFIPSTKEDGTPIVVKKKQRIKKPKSHKPKKQKKAFMTDEEWKALEEEDDEMMFIEEVVEDEK